MVKKVIIKLIVIAGIAIMIQGCATPFSKFYYDQTGGIDITKVPTLIIEDGEPKVFRGNNEEEDSLKMLEDGYVPIGYSSFNAGNVNENGAIAQAKKVHASVVILYSHYTNTASGSMPLTLPDTQTSRTYGSGNAYSSGNIYGYGGSANYSGNTNYSGSSTTTTYGSKTTYIPYNVSKFDYMATYWVKHEAPVFGTFLLDLTNDLRKKISSNKGMLVNVVINDSPAFQTDILKGDILKKIGDVEIINSESFRLALERYAGQSVRVVILRDSDEIEKEIRLNK